MNSFEEKRESFAMSCMLFKAEVNECEELKKRRPITPIDRQTIAVLENDIENVRNVLNRLKDTCGTSSVVIIWKYYIEGKTQKEIANQFKFNLVQLSKTINHYEHIMFE